MLIQFSGSGARTSGLLLVNTPAVTVAYGDDCTSAGGSGNFIADMISGSPSSANYDLQGSASESGPGRTATLTVFPQDAGSDYYLAVSSGCSWSIVVKSG